MHLTSAWKTSEFWLTLLMLALAAVATLAPVDYTPLSLRIVAVLAAALGLCVYARSRAALRITLITSKIARRTAPATQSTETKWALSNIAKPSLNLIALGALGALMLGGLGACSPTSAYVAADQATYNAVAPEYENYVHADPALSADQKARRDRTVQSWQLRINQSGVSVPATQPTSPATQPVSPSNP